MNTINIPQNGLPQELTRIPFGQIFVLTNPFLGITSKNVKLIEFIYSIAKQYGQNHIVNAIPVDYSGLWDCFACKVKTDKGIQILVSDKDSLIEMLCEFWGLDYTEVCNSIVIPERNKSVTCSGESHPIRVSLEPSTVFDARKKGDTTISLGFIQATSREAAVGAIRSTLIDNFNYGFGITLDEVIAIYKAEQDNRKTYRLVIRIKQKEVIEKAKPVLKIKSCELYLVDNTGHEYHFPLTVQSKAIYLTFLLFEGGLRIKEIAGNKTFYQAFKRIYLQLPYGSKASLPQSFDNLNDPGSAQYIYFLQKIGEIRDAIMNVTNDNSARLSFAVEGNAYIPFGIAGATDDHRTQVKEAFELS